MAGSSFERARELFERALELDGEERRAFLASFEDSDLTLDVAALLESHADASDEFLRPPEHEAGAPLNSELAGHVLLEEIARGGMGVVYRARKGSTGRTVALKVVHGGRFASQGSHDRFTREARITASLDHPHIVPLYEVGNDEGHHFFTMKLFRGGNLSAWARAENRSQREVASLLAKIAASLDHAHRRGILHRDIKPANILLDENGEPALGDFGLAKSLDDSDGVSRSGQLFGTVAYLAPERIEGDRQATVASDVYSLGVVLYELLTGEVPFEGPTAAATLRMVETQEPRAPRAVHGDVSADLEAICLRALEKQPEHRYHSAGELAEDLQRFLGGETVIARPVSTLGRGLRWIRRHPAGATIGLLLFALVVGSVVASVLLARARRDAIERLREASVAEARALAGSHSGGVRARSLAAVGVAASIRNDAELRDVAIACLSRTDLELEAELEWSRTTVFVTFDRQLKRCALGHRDGRIELRSLDTPDSRLLELPGEGRVTAMRLRLPHLAVAHEGLQRPDGSRRGAHLCVWHVEERREVFSLEGVHSAFDCENLDFHPTGRVLAFSKQKSVHLVDFETGEELGAASTPLPCGRLRFSPSGDRFFATCGAEIFLFATDSDGDIGLEASPRRLPIEGLAEWAPDGERLVVAFGRELYIHDLEVRQSWPRFQVTSVPYHYRAAFCADGQSVLSTSMIGLLRLHDAGGRLLVETPGQGTLHVAADGSHIAVDGGNERIRRWRLVTSPVHRSFHLPSQHSISTAVSSNGRFVASSSDWGAFLWDLSSQRRLAALPGVSGRVVFLADNSLLTSGREGLHRWPLRRAASEPTEPGSARDEEAEERWTLGPRELLHPEFAVRTEDCGVSPSARYVSVYRDRRFFAIDLAEDRVTPIPSQVNALKCRISPSGRYVAIAPLHGLEIRVVEVATQEVALRIESESGVVSGDIAFHPTRGEIVVGTSRAYGIWNLETGERRLRIPIEGQRAGTSPVSISRDGRYLAISTRVGSIDLYDYVSGQRYARLRLPSGVPIHAIAFNQDGRILASCNGLHGVSIWDLPRLRGELAEFDLDWSAPPLRPLSPPEGPVELDVLLED